MNTQVPPAELSDPAHSAAPSSSIPSLAVSEVVASGAGRIDSLDSLRAIAVLAALGLHLLEVGQVALPSPFWFGWMDVDLFYALSRFSIGSAVLRPMEWDLLRYAKHQFFRIVPAYYASILLVVLSSLPAFLEWCWAYRERFGFRA